MLTGINYLLVTCFVTISTAIRVDWNTNTGPIIPPTPRTTVRPIPPFREPAPVWEDLSNDIPNPNPYIYVPPPPSRPKQTLNTNVNYNLNTQNSNNNYGSLITAQNVNTYYQQHSNNNNQQSQQVAALSPQYIPNVGIRYVAVVPKTATTVTASTTTATKFPAAAANALSPSSDSEGYKLQGKYNAKTKKYKAFEKVKYLPHNYENDDNIVEASSKRNVPEFIPVWVDAYAQELPEEQSSVSFNSLLKWPSSTAIDTDLKATTTTTPSSVLSTKSASTKLSSTTSFKFYSKYVYPKDSTPKSKEKLNKKS